MHKILAFVGPSGSGKTTLLTELVKLMPERLGIIRSITTRPSRGPEDDVFFTRATHAEVRTLEKAGHLLQVSEYAGNLYANDRETLDALLTSKHGLMACVEQGVVNFRHAGYEVVVIRVTPEHKNSHTSAVRESADTERAKMNIGTDFNVVNSFLPDGKEKAVEKLRTFIESLS